MNIHEAKLFDSNRVEYCTFYSHVAEWLKFSKPLCNIDAICNKMSTNSTYRNSYYYLAFIYIVVRLIELVSLLLFL
jgi:hypothetical protein